MPVAQLSDDIREAITEIEATFAGSTVTAEPTGDGGAWVTISPVRLGPPWAQADTWIGFQLVFTYPAADVYPLFVRPDLARIDGAPLGEGLQQPIACGPGGLIPATQVSRATRTLDGATNTAAGKVLKVLHWLATR